MQNLNLFQQERRRRSGPSVRLMLAGQALLWLLLLASAFAVVTMVLKLLRQSGA